MATALFQKILLPVDGSSYSMDAARRAASLARELGSRVLLLHVRDRVPDFLGDPYYQKMLDQALARAEQLVRPYLELLREAGVPVEERLLEGDPAKNILTVAAVEGCDLIVMGSRGLSDLEGLLLGSVSHKVLSSAPCPVLIVR
ncbi:MAG: universal stress protein [Deferrisomatales bacterium]